MEFLCETSPRHCTRQFLLFPTAATISIHKIFQVCLLHNYIYVDKSLCLFSRRYELIQVKGLHIQIYTEETALVNLVTIEAMFSNAFWRSRGRAHAHSIRSSEWNNTVSLLWRNFTFGYTRCNRHREQKILSSSSGSYVMCRAAIITNRKCQMSIATRLLFWTASYRMDNTDSYQFCNLFTCWTFVSVPFVSLPVAINFNSHRKHLPYFQSATILAPDRTSATYNFGFRALPADCFGVPLTFRSTLQLPSLGRIRLE
jgi:hypothetical protein